MLAVADGIPEAGNSPWAGRLDRITAALRAVCKINPGSTRSATGFLLAPDLILTNEHVVASIESRLPGIKVWFGWESGSGDRLESEIAGVMARSEHLDIGVLRLTESVADSIDVPAFDLETVPARLTEIAAVGYPSVVVPGTGHSSDELADIMLGGPGVRGRKRVSPGIIRSASRDLIEHDCSTLHGSSGSPLIDLATGNIVGIHAGGVEGSMPKVNRAAPTRALMCLPTIAAVLDADWISAS